MASWSRAEALAYDASPSESNTRDWLALRYGRLLRRSFTLGQHPELEIGFFSQSPVGEGSTAVFSDITYSAVPIKNVLDGQ